MKRKSYFQMMFIALIAIIFGLVSVECGAEDLKYDMDFTDPAHSGELSITLSDSDTVSGEAKTDIYIKTWHMSVAINIPFQDVPLVEDENGDTTFSFEAEASAMGITCPLRFSVNLTAETFVIAILDPLIASMLGESFDGTLVPLPL